jgi:hypothetical protein
MTQYTQRDPSGFISLPARLVLHADWLLDSALREDQTDIQLA